MSVEPIPVWSLLPNWADEIIETVEFLTTVGESPSAIEQRRGLRLTPRQYFEIGYALKGPERTYFDLLTMRSGGSPCYLPMWHDVELLPYEHPAGYAALDINPTFTEFMNTDAVMLGGPHDYELVEILGRADSLVTLTSGLINAWPARTRVVPLKKVKVDQQPQTTRRTEVVHIARMKFCSIEANRTDADNPLNTFLSQYVLETDPNEVDDLSYNYERVWSTLDNTTGLPTISDVTGRLLQQFSWYAIGRQAHHQLRGLFYALDGRRMPVWVPTVYRDFEPVYPIGAGDLAIDVKRCGFTNLGGPGPQREYILIHARGGTRYYRKITDSVILGDGSVERLFLDAAVGVDLPVNMIRRISFLVLCRLDQDAIEFTHHTNTRGATTTVAVFRSAAAKAGIETIYEVPPGLLPEPVCLSDLLWYQGTPTISGLRTFPDRADQYGNMYDPVGGGFSGPGAAMNVYNPNGVLLRTYNTVDIGNLLNAWAGSTIFNTATFGGFYIWTQPIRQGRYVLVYARTQSMAGVFDHWYTLCEPAADGSLTVKGTVVVRNLTGPPYAGVPHYHEVFSDDQVILCLAQFGLGAWTFCLQALPTINDFLTGTYNGGWPGLHPYQVPSSLLYPVGNEDLSYRLWLTTPTGAWPAQIGFRLPGNGRELYFIYINRTTMQHQLTTTNFTNVEIKTVIGPVYPYGAILKIPVGDISDFAAIATPIINAIWRGRPTEMYTIDNPSWLDADGGTAIPFLDEGTHISDGTVGGIDSYSTIVSTTVRANGRHWVVFVMPGTSDAVYRSPGGGTAWASPLYAKVRLFDWNPATEIATQLGEHVCILHTNEVMSNTGVTGGTVLQNDLYVWADVLETADAATVVLYGRLYKTTFCRFSIPEE